MYVGISGPSFLLILQHFMVHRQRPVFGAHPFWGISISALYIRGEKYQCLIM